MNSDKEKKNEENQLQPQPQLHEGVSKEARVPFLYKQKSKAAMMGNPQPLKILEQKKPSFEPRISKAIRIQRVILLPWEQQFIKNLLCLAAGDMYFDFYAPL